MKHGHCSLFQVCHNHELHEHKDMMRNKTVSKYDFVDVPLHRGAAGLHVRSLLHLLDSDPTKVKP